MSEFFPEPTSFNGPPDAEEDRRHSDPVEPCRICGGCGFYVGYDEDRGNILERCHTCDGWGWIREDEHDDHA